MSRELFLTLASCVALAVGAFAVAFPRLLLAGKGVAPGAAVTVWMREVGVLLVATGVTVFLVRAEPDSATLRAVLAGNCVAQLGLLGIEPAAYARGVITKLSGIVPNTVLHVVLAAGFAYYAAT